MARRHDSRAERLTGYVVLLILGVITAWLLVQQSRFNPAVVAALRPPVARPQAQAGPQAGPVTETGALLGTLAGLDPLSPVESFDQDTLSDKIDGKAELYLASNFREMSCRTFTVPAGPPGPGVKSPGPAHVEVYLYAMDTAKDAFAVFSGQRRSGAADSQITRNAYATDNALFFSQGRYYVEMVADRALGQGDTARAVQSAGAGLAATLAAGPPGGPAGQAEASATGPAPSAEGAVDEPALFPKPGLQAGTVRLTVSDAFGMEGLGNIYTADYVLASGEATAFLSARTSPEEARGLADRYLAFLSANGYHEDPAGPALPDGAKLLVLDGGGESAWEVVAPRGKMLAGVHEATSRGAALELAAAVGQAVGSMQ